MLDVVEYAFEGDRQCARDYLRGLPVGAFYTYVLLTPGGLPFYVGKGKGDRVLQHEAEALRNSKIHKTNPYKCNKIRKIVGLGDSVGYRIDRVYELDEIACLKREQALISHYGRRCDGGVLTNLAAGLGSPAARDPLSAERHAATLSGVVEGDGERTALNLYLQSLGAVASVPIKPLAAYRSRLVGAYPSPKALKNASLRNGLTIVASVLASGLRITSGTIVPRKFMIAPEAENWPLDGPPPEVVEGVIENGAASDILKLGLVSLVRADRPEDEGFRIDAGQAARIIGLVGRDYLEEWDLV
ncbi:GIY-YIG nuclease family protein [Alphaproteobacteria bacterium KMM 3653]|uniref:GIY-YIG nuclease family protein n=1 Tax=Harenicola maris TaxID=2841044 RepID=A0AAP2G2W6_9RHOB|nr:GIY-YIG nuclease family protein [Harenicola maris]